MNIKVSKMCVANIEDKLQSIKYELSNSRQSYDYLNEKLSSIENDVAVLRNETNRLKGENNE